MSDYCASCTYDVAVKAGPDACPFNYLYWNFLIENEDTLAGNPRMTMPYRILRGLGDKRRAEIRRDAAAFFAELSSEPEPAHQGDQTATAK
jgi:deoxyribodipyrimidine photolyase-related protein